MNKKHIAIAIGCLLALAIIPLSILAVGYLIRSTAKSPGIALEELVKAATGLLGENKTTITITGNTLTITPISEISLASQTVRQTMVYKRTWLKSECVVVAQQDFTVKYGYRNCLFLS